MSARVLFSSDYVAVTPSVARFGATSYQIANIGSIAIRIRNRMNGLAVVLILLGLAMFGLGGFLIVQHAESAPYGPYLIVAGAVLFIFGLVLQSKRPAREYTLMLKTSSNDLEVLVSLDHDHIMKVKAAIEEAFALRLDAPYRMAGPNPTMTDQ
jgi:uncharacterized membrane protein